MQGEELLGRGPCVWVHMEGTVQYPGGRSRMARGMSESLGEMNSRK